MAVGLNRSGAPQLFFVYAGAFSSRGSRLEARAGKPSGSLKTGQSALIAANGTDSLIDIASPLISFAPRERRFHPARSDPLTLRWKKKREKKKKNPFYLSLSVIDWSRKRKGLG